MKAWMIVTALLLVGCKVTPQQSYVADVDSHTWRASAVVQVPNSDTLSLRTLHILVRSNENLDHDTLTLRIATLSPNMIRFEEALKLNIPRTLKASALHREATIVYRQQVILTDTGHYRFTLTPTRVVQGVEAIGIYIENNTSSGTSG